MQAHRTSTLATGEDIDHHFQDALRLLRAVRRTLSELVERFADGETGLFREVGLKSAELESALKRAFEAEERYNDWHARNSGLRNAALEPLRARSGP